MPTAIRSALLDDTSTISSAFRAQIGVWQRVGADGRGETVDYADLTIYQRWLHGGAWMSIETGAIWLNHLLRGAGIALVACHSSGALIGYAEACITSEPDPIGRALHLHDLIAEDDETTRAMLVALFAEAKKHKCARVTATRIGAESRYDGAATLTPLASLRRYTLSARQGQVFYRAVDHADADAGQIAGWAMPIGRVSSARTEWERLWVRQFETIPELAERKTQRLALAVAGQDAFVHIQRYMYDPRAADVAVWSPKPLTVQVISAVRDWAHREGYRSLRLAVHDEDRPALGADADADGSVQETCALTLVTE
ncbi:MAG: hypothetical protein SGJ24_09460 [Chloroflexota bacterium]|nr:hypothetical protein [Chloroflexota bacterium]